MRDIDFVQQLVTKLCHELSGPIGAFNNGIEAFEMEEGEMASLNMKMTKRSAEACLARLMFFRAVYGISRSSSEAPASSILQVARTYLADYDLSLDIKSGKQILISSHAIKIFLCIIWLCAKALPQGGRVEALVSEDPEGSKKFVISCEGPRISEEMLKLDILEGRKSTISDTPEIHSYYTRRLLDDIGAQLRVDVGSSKLEFIVTIIPV